MARRSRVGSHVGGPLSLLSCAIVWCGCGGAAPAPTTPAPGGGAARADVSTGPLTGADGRPLPTRVDCGDFATCARLSDGTVQCWGGDDEGELGDGGGPDQSKPRPVPGLAGVERVALGASMGCAVRGGSVLCWGTGKLVPGGPRADKAKPRDVPGVSGVVDLDASGSFTCARTKGGETTCWGMDNIDPIPKGVTQLAAGFAHACGVVGDAVKCWGSGDDDWTVKGLFANVPVPGVKRVATGDRHACALTSAGAVLCWGNNDVGQLGSPSDMDTHDKPREVPGVRGAVDIVAGESSTCAVLGDGTVTCWGANAEGELGIGRESDEATPTKVAGLSGVSQVCLAIHHGCALTRERKVLCWGNNSSGQIGDGTKDTRLAPVEIAF